MGKKLYILRIRDLENPKLINSLLSKFLEIFQEFCTVDLIIQERTSYDRRKNIKAKGLEPWLY